jgi:hypothetical protein
VTKSASFFFFFFSFLAISPVVAPRRLYFSFRCVSLTTAHSIVLSSDSDTTATVQAP